LDAASNKRASQLETRGMAGTSGTSHTDRKYDHSQSFPRLERNTPAREGLRNGKAEAPPVLSFGEVALFRIFGKATRGLSEDPKTHQVAHWRWRFFGSRGKKTIGGSDSNVSPQSDGLTKRRKCVSAAAASSGFARVQDRANVVKAARRQRAFTWVFRMPHSKACVYKRPLTM